MNARGKGITTPNHRTEPPSAVKNVEESRQQRLQRAQSRFRDRGGIFVPTNRNTLIDILLGKKDASPKKSRRSRSRSVSPQKPLASPSIGKGKRVSLSSSAAIAAGDISVSQPELRRSPRKKSATASSKPSTSQKTDASKRKVQEQDTEDEDPIVAPTTKSRKGKQVAQDLPVEDKPKKRTSRNTKEKAKELARRGRQAKGTKESEASTSQLSSQALDSDPNDLPLPSKSRTKKLSSRTTDKLSKSKQAATDDEDEDDDISLATIKSRSQTTKRKLSIVQEEEEEVSEHKSRNATSRALSSPAPPSRKKLKVVPLPDRSPSPPPVKRSNSKARNSKPTKAKTGTAVKKPIILSDDESDAEPPLPKAAQKKPRGPDDDVNTRPAKKTTKGKGKALVETDAEDEGEPEAFAKAKGKGLAKNEAGDGATLPAKKSSSRKAKPAADVVDPPPKGRTKSKAKPSEDLGHDEAAKRKPDGSRKGKVAEEQGEEPEPEIPVLKRSRSKAIAQASVDHEDPPPAARSKRKRPIGPGPEEDETTPTKKAKTLPLQDVDEQSPPSMRTEAKGRTRKPPSKVKPPSKGDSRKLKENTPTSDCSEGRPVRHTRSRPKPSPKITGPRKSVMVRMLEPLPPLEDNDPDPIDFLS